MIWPAPIVGDPKKTMKPGEKFRRGRSDLKAEILK